MRAGTEARIALVGVGVTLHGSSHSTGALALTVAKAGARDTLQQDGMT